MKKIFVILMAFIASLGTAMRAQTNIIPMPVETVMSEGQFHLSPSTTVSYDGKQQVIAPTIAFFIERLNRATGQKLQYVGKNKADITFKLDKRMKKAESYELTVTPEGIEIKAGDSDGLFWGMQSLLQLCPPQVESKGQAIDFASQGWDVPCLTIKDYPRFDWRGVMFDPCRHFLAMDDMKKQIDVLSQYKINKVQLHLTEDQGWRIEIKKYPKLTEIGSKRLEAEGTVTEGFYTQEELKDLVKYAAERHIEIVPELEMPGHELAAIAAYPELSCRGEKITPRIIWGVEDIVMCPGKEKMFTFLQDVIDEMVEIFPSKYFHIGGDESPRVEWKNCPLCQARMKKLGYTKEAQLQDYIIDRMGKYLKKKKKELIGWDEILEGGNLQKNAIVMSWRGEEGGINAAKKNHRVLMTPASHALYFDHYQGDHMAEKTCIGGYAPIEKLYAYNPVPEVLTKAKKGHLVMGVQANNWSEYTMNGQELEHKLFPRALALAEIAWTPVKEKNFENFVERLDDYASKMLAYEDIDFYITQPSIKGVESNSLVFTDKRTIELTTSRPQNILYSIDGGAPQKYTKPLTFDKSAVLYTFVVLPSGQMGPIRTITLEKVKPTPSVKLDDKKEGLNLQVYMGKYRRPYDLIGVNSTKTAVLKNLEKLSTQAKRDNAFRHVEDYAAIASGYFKVEKTGVYEVSSLNNQVYIDGQLVVDNSEVAQPRDTRANTEVALEAGWHEIKVIFIGGIFGGFPTYWNDDNVKLRPVGGKFMKIAPKDLAH